MTVEYTFISLILIEHPSLLAQGYMLTNNRKYREQKLATEIVRGVLSAHLICDAMLQQCLRNKRDPICTVTSYRVHFSVPCYEIKIISRPFLGSLLRYKSGASTGGYPNSFLPSDLYSTATEVLCATTKSSANDSSEMNTSKESSDSAFGYVPGIRLPDPPQRRQRGGRRKDIGSSDGPVAEAMSIDESDHSSTTSVFKYDLPASNDTDDDYNSDADPNNPHNVVPPDDRADILKIYHDMEDTTRTTVARAAPQRKEESRPRRPRMYRRQPSSFNDGASAGENLCGAGDGSKTTGLASAEPVVHRAAVFPKQTSKKAKGRPLLSKNCRVFIFRKHLFHLCTPKQQEYISRDYHDKHAFFGYNRGAAQGSGNKYHLEMDTLPKGMNFVKVQRKKFIVAKPEEEEETAEHFDYLYDAEEDAEEAKKAEKNPRLASIRAFCRMEDDDVRKAKEFTMKIDPKKNIEVVWRIVPDGEDVEVGDFNCPMSAPDLQGVDWDSPIFDILLESFFPFSAGVAKVMDKYLSDEQASYNTTFESQGIRFHDPDADDPDWKVKQCICLTLAATMYPEASVLLLV